MYGDLEDPILRYLHRNITPQVNKVLKTQKLSNFEIQYDVFCFQDCTQSLKLEFFMSFIERFNLLVRTLNMNEDENVEKLHGISTNFIRKLTDLICNNNW